MENKQTAVMWLENELKVRPKPIYNSDIDKLFEQAKAIEREQIEEAYKDGFEENVRPRHDDASDYFTKKYQNGK